MNFDALRHDRFFEFSFVGISDKAQYRKKFFMNKAGGKDG